MEVVDKSTLGPASPPGISRFAAGYLIFLLLAINTINYVDRQLPAILAQSIKHDLHLSDTELGLLGGIAFALSYGALALPLARLADRWSTKWVIVGSLTVWSALTSLGGLARNFAQLVVARMGVAMGEAGCVPSAHSIIASTVPPERRSFAVAVFSLGTPIGIMGGMALGGWLNDLHSWRFAMIVMGIPGLVIAALAALTLSPSAERRETPARASFVATARSLGRFKSYRHLLIGAAIYGIGAHANIQFLPAFLIRTYGLSTTKAGLALGLVNGIAGGVSTLIGGWLGDIAGRNNPGRVLLVPVFGFIFAAPFFGAALFAPSAAISVAFLVVAYLAHFAYLGPIYSSAQRLASPGTRAMAAAIIVIGLSVVGASIGPYVTGLASDALMPLVGKFSLRYALLIGCATNIWAALHLWIASRSMGGDVMRVQEK